MSYASILFKMHINCLPSFQAWGTKIITGPFERSMSHGSPAVIDNISRVTASSLAGEPFGIAVVREAREVHLVGSEPI